MIKVPKFSQEDIRYLQIWHGIKPVSLLSVELGRTEQQIKDVCEELELDVEVK